MFSGAQQPVESFFVELPAQLKIRPDLAQVGQDLEDYGETFSGDGVAPTDQAMDRAWTRGNEKCSRRGGSRLQIIHRF